MICHIPARGNSRRLENKNVLNFFGRPLILWVIDLAKRSHLFDDVIVTTDDTGIYHICEPHTRTLRRPPEIRGDIMEDLVNKWVLDYTGEERMCRLYSSNVLLTQERLLNGARAFDYAECVLECVPFEHPPHRALTVDGGYLMPDVISRPTDSFSELCHEPGSFLYVTRDALDRPLGERKIKWLRVERSEVQDLDDAEDLELLKWKFYRRNI